MLLEPAGRKKPEAAVGWFFAGKTAREALMMGGFVCADGERESDTCSLL